MAVGKKNDQMHREAPTDIDVLIVGAGLAGLYFAIECYRQGHSPQIVESKSGVELIGRSSSNAFDNRTLLTSPLDRRFCRHWYFCHKAIQEMARHGTDIQQYRIQACNDHVYP
jgi:2-polyprenyl-6-methoxyphenol hydroxylase-like FAD-dependent oxidoreductase